MATLLREMTMKAIVSFAGLFALSIAASDPVVRIAGPDERPPPATLADVAWLEGRWEGQALGGEVTEVYARTSETQMVGLFTLAKSGQPVFHEFVILEEQAGSLRYRIKHFNADFSEWEPLGETVDMSLIAIENDAIHFSGMSFIRAGRDAMQVQLLIDQDGTRRPEYFDYRRARSSALEE